MIKRANLKEIIDNNIFKVSRSGIDPRKVKNLLSGPGVDYLPEEDCEVYYSQIGNNPDDLIIIALNDGITKDVEKGEIKIYSISTGLIQAFIHLKNDGTIILNKDDDNAVRYSELETAFNKLKDDFNLFKASHKHTGVQTGSGTSAVSDMPDPSLADITGAKIDDIKVPGVVPGP